MKRTAGVLLLLCFFLSLFTVPAFADGRLLGGAFGELEPIYNGLSSPFYLDKKVVDCRALSLTLAVADYTGDPFGSWYLFAQDLDGNWDHIAELELSPDLADGRTRVYDLWFVKPLSFKALALCIRDPGAAFSLDWKRVEFRLGDVRPRASGTNLPRWAVARGLLPIDGSWGEAIPIRNGLYPAYVLDRKLSYCKELTMSLTISGYTGWPFGDWYLYAQDLKDNWDHIGEFRIEKEQADGAFRLYTFSFQPPETFKALAICIRDPGSEFTVDWDIAFYAP